MCRLSSICVAVLLLAVGCQRTTLPPVTPGVAMGPTLKPAIITDPVRYDTDDPAIWINPKDPSQSLIIGTDKNSDGALYVFDLQGKEVPGRTVHGLERPNNVDVAYGLPLGGQPTDLVVTTERERQRLRIFRLPDMQPLDNGGLSVFTGEAQNLPMGIALYTRPSDKAMFAIVGRKDGPTTGYLWQYRLEDDGTGHVKMTLVRKFGTYSGRKEIESIAVDNELGYIYYSDEGVGVRQYYADPTRGDEQLSLFATQGFTEDHEGISIYKTSKKKGYLLVSDQGANQFHIYRREEGKNHSHELVKVIKVEALHSDGSDVTSIALNKQFPKGLFVVMSEGRYFHYYRWEDVAGRELK
ncbi:phytase [Hymenobacter profundi]|uniref:Phytase n=1 Tax=Hymenobacter profundi TaxID=1982110 RepID=A0ABS6X174_9BACT|nr:phytase [Hymenobacter profundi]MBW3129257.1 phytase [Hymenobacter profundi]